MNKPQVLRGQATTELAVGSLVLVTLLLYGIHFSEAGFSLLKAKEAAAYAMHSATGARTHLFDPTSVSSGSSYAPFDPVAAGNNANNRYRSGMKGVLTEVTGASVRCEADNTVAFNIQSPASLSPPSSAALAYLRTVYRNRGGVACRANAQMELVGVPEFFAEGSDGFFQEKHARYTQLPICGAGMPSSGRCLGKLATLTGDWGFEGPLRHPSNGDVEDFQNDEVKNRAYAETVRQLFVRSGAPYADSTSETPAQRMMRIAGGMDGSEEEWLEENRFSMSYLGEQGGTRPTVKKRAVHPDYNPALKYQTVGADLEGNRAVDWEEGPNGGVLRGVPRCFLGLFGCAASEGPPGR